MLSEIILIISLAISCSSFAGTIGMKKDWGKSKVITTNVLGQVHFTICTGQGCSRVGSIEDYSTKQLVSLNKRIVLIGVVGRTVDIVGVRSVFIAKRGKSLVDIMTAAKLRNLSKSTI